MSSLDVGIGAPGALELAILALAVGEKPRKKNHGFGFNLTLLINQMKIRTGQVCFNSSNHSKIRI